MLCFAAVTLGASTVNSFLAELLLISAVALGCKHLGLPSTIAPVAARLLVGLLRGFFELKVHLTPGLLFVVLLPALLFEAATLEIRERQEILLLTFGCGLLSVFVQGLSIKGLLGRLGMGTKSEPLRLYEALWAELTAQEKALALLRNHRSRRLLSEGLYEEMRKPLVLSIESLEKQLAKNQIDEETYLRLREKLACVGEGE